MGIHNSVKRREMTSRMNPDGQNVSQAREDLTVKTLTAAGITNTGVNLRTGGDKTLAVTVADAATYAVLAANSGKIHLVANQAQDIVITLPTAAAGLYYEFWSTMVAADGHDWTISTGSNTNYFLGGIHWIDSDVAETTAAEVTIMAGNGSSNSKLKIDLPSVNTVVRVYCDGTLWYLSGQAFSTTTPAFSDQ